MGSSLKERILARRIQEIEIDDEGTVLASDNAFIDLNKVNSLAQIHPFFLSIIPLLPTVDKSLSIPCVNIESGLAMKIVDVDIQRKDKKLYLLLVDLTEHYEASQPLVQEKNIASITKHKLAFEKRLLQAKEEFKNNFLAHLNHEIRNPLNNLLGFMELLKETKLDYDQNEMLKVMQRTGTHLKVLMDDMLDISKIERGVLDIKAVNFNLGHLVTNLQNHFQFKYHDSPVALEVSIEGDVPKKLIGDPVRLNQILFNLLENAFRNTETGLVSLLVSATHKSPQIANIHISVSDSGTSIPEDKLDRIFESYFQLQLDKIKPIGEGLGLKIVKDLTESLKGTISVESRKESGTTFHCTLPFKIRPETKRTKSIPKGSGILMSKRILIVEDETTNQMLFMKTFLNNEKGYVIEIALNGEHALQMLANNNYSLIIFKTSLPDISAEKLIAEIQNHGVDAIANMPILIASGNTIKEAQKAILDAGAHAFLPKPYSKKELFNCIDRLVR